MQPWFLKRKKLNRIIYEHKTKTYICSPNKLKLDVGTCTKEKPKLVFTLYPCGLEEDCGNTATLEIEIQIPKKCPRLPSSAKVNLSVTVWECNEGSQYLKVSDFTVEELMSLRQFIIFKLITHTFLRESRSNYIKITASTKLIGVSES